MAEPRELSVRYCKVEEEWTVHSRPQHKPNDEFTCDLCAKFIKDNIKSVNISPGFKGA